MGQRKWHRFDEPAARNIHGNIRASITPEGEITFDEATYRELGEPQAMFMLYEPETETIGLEPGSADDRSTVLVRMRHKGRNRVVRSRRFFKKHGILPARTLLIPYAYVEDKVLVLDLRTAVAYGVGWKRVQLAETRRAGAKEVRDERTRALEEIRAEKERLRAERNQLSQERARIARQQRETERERREWERKRTSEIRKLEAANEKLRRESGEI